MRTVRLLVFLSALLAWPLLAKEPAVPDVHAVDYRLPNGLRVIYVAKLDGGLDVELYARAADVDISDDDAGAQVPELAGVA